MLAIDTDLIVRYLTGDRPRHGFCRRASSPQGGRVRSVRQFRSELCQDRKYSQPGAGYTQGDLGRLIGSRQRASDILSRKRRLTMGMAWKLHRKWGIPAEALIRPQPRSRRRFTTAVG